MKKLCVTLALLYAPFAHAAYKCVDERGVTLIGDVPPAGCANVVMYEITSSGQVRRKIDPTPTPEQLKSRLEEQQKKREEDRIAFERKRKDLALLNTYSSEQEIDVARDRNIEPIRGRIKGAQERLDAVVAHLKQVDEQIEDYQAGKKAPRGAHGEKARAEPPAPPAALVAERDRARKEKASLEKSIADANKEIDAVRTRYEADKRRFAEIKADPSLVQAAERASR
jgi:hypothetical protein